MQQRSFRIRHILANTAVLSAVAVLSGCTTVIPPYPPALQADAAAPPLEYVEYVDDETYEASRFEFAYAQIARHGLYIYLRATLNEERHWVHVRTLGDHASFLPSEFRGAY